MEITEIPEGCVSSKKERSYVEFGLHLKKVFEALIQTLEIDESKVYILDERALYGMDSISIVIRYKIKNATYGFKRIIHYNREKEEALQKEIWYYMEEFKASYNEFRKEKHRVPEWIHILD